MLIGQNLAETHSRKEQSRVPRRYALAISLSYLLVTCLWIYFSTHWVATLANGDAVRLEYLQKMKGFSFMLVSAIASYFAIRWVSKQSAAQARDLQETQERWMEAERQAAPALLASCIAHDVANLLTVIRLNLERTKRFHDLPPVVADSLVRMDNGTDRLTELVKRLRGASSSLFHESPVRFDFSKSVGETLSLLEGHVCCEAVTIELIPASGAMLSGYPILVHQLVMNLLINAAEATERTGRVRFTVSRRDDGVALSVEDNGPGIAPSLRQKVMSAFFTTKSTGSGLGLTSVRSCVDIHAGTMQIEDSELGGAKFSIWLPDLSAVRLEQLRHPNAASNSSTTLRSAAAPTGVSSSSKTKRRAPTPDHLQL